jgi:hypothetical protein
MEGCCSSQNAVTLSEKLYHNSPLPFLFLSFSSFCVPGKEENNSTNARSSLLIPFYAWRPVTVSGRARCAYVIRITRPYSTSSSTVHNDSGGAVCGGACKQQVEQYTNFFLFFKPKYLA